ncbi:hypothetical protein [Piscirickettsia salmonis]|uniref:hypothetical protein n=1 Tax=Piscirickettsia salmonis TaxID=1238 RepID=UPI0007C8B692|nr:hypothetical protein A0O36_02796 [Piscirickettsiaceae bacterium NZ-RLO1]
MPTKYKTAFNKEELLQFIKDYKPAIEKVHRNDLLKIFRIDHDDMKDINVDINPHLKSSPFSRPTNLNCHQILKASMANPFRYKPNATLEFQTGHEGLIFKRTIRLGLRLMALNRVTKECPLEPFTPEVLDKMRRGVKELRELYFPEVTAFDTVRRTGYCLLSIAGGALAVSSNIKDTTVTDLTVMGHEVSLGAVTGTLASALFANAMKEGYGLIGIAYPFKNISGLELDNIIAEEMGGVPKKEYSNCLSYLFMSRADEICSQNEENIQLNEVVSQR